MQKAVIVLDSFKGCLSSKEAGIAAQEGILSAFPQAQTLLFPVSDGGEGFLEAWLGAQNGQRTWVNTQDPLGQPLRAPYGLSANKQTALLEMAQVCGLNLVPLPQRDPTKTSSYGLGELIKNALEHHCQHIILGLGGSATNEGGLGLMQSLGVRLLDKNLCPLPQGVGGGCLEQIRALDFSQMPPQLKDALKKTHFTVAADVDNPLCGPKGATQVYGPQKGASPQQVALLEKGMQSWGKLLQELSSQDVLSFPGAGAAGGVGAAAVAFLGAKMCSGIETLLDALDFEKHIKKADFILTGEGSADAQTLQGKVPYGVLKKAQKQNIPVFLMAGRVQDKSLLLKAGFAEVFALSPASLPLEKAMNPQWTRSQIRFQSQKIAQGF